MGDVGGVGRKIAGQLSAGGVRTVPDLLRADVATLRRQFSVVFEKTVLELRGTLPAKACARSKGPQQDFELTGSYTVGGQQRTVTASLLLVQPKPNILQPLAYAIADWRAAALGQRTPNCQFWKTGDRTADCEPVPSPLAPKDLW